MKRPSPHSEVGRTEKSRSSGLHLLLVKRWWHKADDFVVSQAWWEERDRNLAGSTKESSRARKPAAILKGFNTILNKKHGLIKKKKK